MVDGMMKFAAENLEYTKRVFEKG